MAILSVINFTTTVPPVAPSFGDAYLVPPAATGVWAGKSRQIALFTARGWVFIPPVEGRWLYNESTDGFLRYTAAGLWQNGPGSSSITTNSVPLSAAINFGRYWIVENQTTNAPPGSPAVGVAYIIGSSPTGAWAGKAAQVAVCEVTGTWTYYSPTAGYSAYDKSNGIDYEYTGSAWRSVASGYAGRAQAVDNARVSISGSGLAQSNNAGTYTVAPTTASAASAFETLTLSYTAHRAGAVIEVAYQASFGTTFNGQYTPGSGATGTVYLWIGLFVDSEASARDWIVVASATLASGVAVTPAGQPSAFNNTFTTTIADASAHTYKVAFIAACGAGSNMGSSPTDTTNFPIVQNRRLLLKEAA